MIGAGLNVVPTALLVLGIGAVVLAVAPRGATRAVYGVVIWSLVVDLLNSMVSSVGWLDHLSLFHYMALAPAQDPDPVTVLITLALAGVLCIVATILFERRDVETGWATQRPDGLGRKPERTGVNRPSRPPRTRRAKLASSMIAPSSAMSPCRASAGITARSSARARCWPMQPRGPNPNGSNVRCASEPASSCRDGSKRSGSFQTSGSRLMPRT